ncbi:hypothetical protein [Jatrophihabitans sp.]|jgi:hypothetical protein|uniref:hypothetical protein n=1 Tax=Jatrophihabitans sp. TaxID=1932789 RepID=UPI002EEDFC17
MTAPTTAPPPDSARKRLGRSPSYPGITLGNAIKRAQKLYEKEKLHPTPIGVVAKHWGFKSNNTGPASVTYAALIKYGLLSDEGTGDNRQAKLTDLAVKILLSPDEAERAAALKEAALKPPIHAEMWELYGADLPTDDTLRYKMAINGRFTETGFDEFIRVYRDVIAFANLTPEDKMDGSGTADLEEPEPEDGDRVPDPGEVKPPPPGTRPPGKERRIGMTGDVQTIAVPMLNAPPVIVEGHFPLSEAEWTYFMTVLSAMKTGLVGEPKNDHQEDE